MFFFLLEFDSYLSNHIYYDREYLSNDGPLRVEEQNQIAKKKKQTHIPTGSQCALDCLLWK